MHHTIGPGLASLLGNTVYKTLLKAGLLKNNGFYNHKKFNKGVIL